VTASAFENKKANASTEAAKNLMTFSPCDKTARFKLVLGQKLDLLTRLARHRKTL
jgi:hypothetical protein